MTDGDDKLSRRYRELAREEPSSRLDAAILGASRHAVAKPSLARRWGVPVSIAAVMVLAFGLTLEMQHEKPDVSTSPPAPAPVTLPSALPPGSAPMQAPEEEAPAEEKKPAKHEAARIVAPAQPRAQPVPQLKKSAPVEESSRRDELQAAPARPATITAPVTSAPPPEPPRMTPNAPNAPAAADYNVAPATIAPAQRAKSATSAIGATGLIASPYPQQELEHIAKLRTDGNDAEADRLLGEFLRTHPGYSIPDAMWERVKPR